MTIDGAELLRMLEPVTRPDGIASDHAARSSIEARSFDSLLREVSATQLSEDARQASAPAAATDADAEDRATDGQLLASLGSVDRIQSASLRQVLGKGETR